MSLTLLVVDDSAVMRSMLIRTLQMSALPVTTVLQAGSADAALTVLAQHPVDVAVVDLLMPDPSGDDLFQRMRADTRLAHVGVVMVMPEGAEPGHAADLASRGASLLRKPFTPEQARAAVLQVMATARAQ